MLYILMHKLQTLAIRLLEEYFLWAQESHLPPADIEKHRTL